MMYCAGESLLGTTLRCLQEASQYCYYPVVHSTNGITKTEVCSRQWKNFLIEEHNDRRSTCVQREYPLSTEAPLL
jgi:hypothetical protein